MSHQLTQGLQVLFLLCRLALGLRDTGLTHLRQGQGPVRAYQRVLLLRGLQVGHQRGINALDAGDAPLGLGGELRAQGLQALTGPGIAEDGVDDLLALGALRDTEGGSRVLAGDVVVRGGHAALPCSCADLGQPSHR